MTDDFFESLQTYRHISRCMLSCNSEEQIRVCLEWAYRELPEMYYGLIQNIALAKRKGFKSETKL